MTAVSQMSARYSSIPMVVANDLRNEIRKDNKNHLTPRWGSEGLFHKDVDWRDAATRGGNAVLEVAPNQLIIVEGLNYANDMSPIKKDPIQLD